MFSPNDSSFMYPTRLPFEESTIYSQVNIKCPDLEAFPNFKVNITFLRINNNTCTYNVSINSLQFLRIQIRMYMNLNQVMFCMYLITGGTTLKVQAVLFLSIRGSI